jgi:hypothetical protein
MKRVYLVFGAIALLSLSLQAQKIKIESGDFDFLKGESIVKLEYDYSDMAVGKFDREEEYVNKKVEEYNKKYPGTGRGEQWKEAWIGDRKSRFEPKFEELLNNYLKPKGISIAPEHTDATCTMILKTTFTEPGFNVYVTKKPAMIDVEAIFVETANPDNVLGVISSLKNPGRTFGDADFDTGVRISEAYAKCGKELGAFLVKKVL